MARAATGRAGGKRRATDLRRDWPKRFLTASVRIPRASTAEEFSVHSALRNVSIGCEDCLASGQLWMISIHGSAGVCRAGEEYAKSQRVHQVGGLAWNVLVGLDVMYCKSRAIGKITLETGKTGSSEGLQTVGIC